MSENKKIVTWIQAYELGLTVYFTGKPCFNDHVDDRYVSNNQCKSCAIKTSKRHSKKARERQKKHYIENKDYYSKMNSIYYLENKEKIYRQKVKYRKEYPEKINTLCRNRNARLKNAEGHHIDDDILDMLNSQDGKCAEPTCRKDLTDGYHVDHIMPISKGGSNWPSNLQCLCPTCNTRKGAMLPIEWAVKNGRPA